MLDANVWVSAAISRGPAQRVVAMWLRAARFEVLICGRLLDEVRVVLVERSRLRRWISRSDAECYVSTLEAVADVLPDPPPGPRIVRDPEDDYLIHLARRHDADLIVSGDGDLLDWPEQRPPVATPGWFEARLAAG